MDCSISRNPSSLNGLPASTTRKSARNNSVNGWTPCSRSVQPVFVKAVEVAQVRVHSRSIGIAIVGTDVKRVFEVVQIAKVNILVHGIAALRLEQNVLHFRPADAL